MNNKNILPDPSPVLYYLPDEEEERQWKEIEERMSNCVLHKQPEYLDTEGDGCPNCGYASK
jgi:hypothetical protein